MAPLLPFHGIDVAFERFSGKKISSRCGPFPQPRTSHLDVYVLNKGTEKMTAMNRDSTAIATPTCTRGAIKR